MATRHSNLRTVLVDLGDLVGACTHHERALEIGQATLRPDHVAEDRSARRRRRPDGTGTPRVGPVLVRSRPVNHDNSGQARSLDVR